MRGRVLTFLLVVSCLVPALAGQTPGWEAATQLYLAGHADAALDMIARLPRDEVRDGGRDYLGRERDSRRAQALLALWTEVHLEMYEAIAADPTKVPDPWWPRLVCRWAGVVQIPGDPTSGKVVLSNPAGTLIQIVQAQRRPSTEFLEAWYVLVLARWSPSSFSRDDCLGLAPGTVKRSPEMLLAVGRHQENKWFESREAGSQRRIIPNLGEGRDALQRALEQVPTMDEARLRLGHVTSLMGDEEEALKILGTVVAPMNPKFVYLARVFEAEIYEKRGDLARTQGAYEQALAAYAGQSARVALARVMFMRGNRRQAGSSLAWIDDTLSPGLRDPWAEYYYGFEGQLQKYRERLRAAVVKDR